MIRRTRSYQQSFLVALLTACATTGGIRGAPLNEGTAQTFASGYDRVLNASREAMVEAGLHIEEANKVSDRLWIIIGKKDMSGFSWGELVRVAVEQTSTQETTVRVVTQRRLATNVAAKDDYSKSILSNIELKLK